MKSNHLKYKRIPRVIRQKGIKQTPIQQIAKQDGTVRYQTMGRNFNHQVVDYHTPVIFLDTRSIPITFHKHDYVELVYVLDGQLLSKSRTDTLQLKEGDFWLTQVGEEHALFCYDGEATIANICIPMEMFEYGAYRDFYVQNTGLVSKFLKKKGQPNASFLYFSSTTLSEYKWIMERILLEANQKEVNKASIVALVLYLLSIFSKEEYNDKRTYDEKMNHILNYMEQQYASVSVNDIAKHFNYTENYLTRYIKKATGQNATKLILELKLSKACELLAETSDSIEKIAETVGYKSSAYFYTVFKNKYHMTPAQFRELNKKHDIDGFD